MRINYLNMLVDWLTRHRKAHKLRVDCRSENTHCYKRTSMKIQIFQGNIVLSGHHWTGLPGVNNTGSRGLETEGRHRLEGSGSTLRRLGKQEFPCLLFETDCSTGIHIDLRVRLLDHRLLRCNRLQGYPVWGIGHYLGSLRLECIPEPVNSRHRCCNSLGMSHVARSQGYKQSCMLILGCYHSYLQVSRWLGYLMPADISLKNGGQSW